MMLHNARFLLEELGAVAVTTALALVPILGMVGVGVDASRAYLVEARLGQSLDAAGLAGGKMMFDANRNTIIQQYFNANFPSGYMGARVGAISISADSTNENLTVSTSATLNTGLMQLMGTSAVTVGAHTTVHRESRGMELALVMDNTGSMQSGGKIDAMKAGATDLINILFGQNAHVANVWVNLIPYTAAVNVGAQHTNWLVPGALAALKFYTTTWKGCVEARWSGINDMTDSPPSVEKFQPFYYPKDTDNLFPPIDETTATNTTSNNGTGPNLGCPPAITAMQTDKTAILNAITQMGAWHRGGTMANLGLVWGWATLSPRWRGLWSSATPQLPLDYGTPYMDKVIVLLTDGVNEWYDNPPAGPSGSDYTAYGRLGWGRIGSTNATTATNTVNQRMSNLCQTLKRDGIIIYTITFQVPDATTRALYQNCASKPSYYFDSPTNDVLRSSFLQIANSLSNLRISQ
jgi:Flp pilus assembly protein TadG